MSGSVTYVDEGGEERTACADMVAGCDGVNSVVRGVASVAMVGIAIVSSVVRLDLLWP